jgi:hypothetical protein
MNHRIGKITLRDAEGRVLGTVERKDEAKYEYQVRRTRGFAGSYNDAVGMVRKISALLDKRCDAA